ncbi:MAG: SDR family NAD(P)-dependent oxidoreductase [Candidatus Heimdallarchaeota archaeon]
MRLQNETAIITGSTSGIGKKLAELFLREGCKVAISSRSKDKVDSTVKEFRKQFGENVIGMACDVTNPADLEKLVNETTSAFGSVRILIANAGLNTLYGPFECMSPKMVKENACKIMSTNLIGTINTISAILPQMKKQEYGRLITLSGGGADRPIDNMTLYSASKGGVVAFSKCLALELEQSGLDIKLNIYQPGMIKTGLTTTVSCVPNWKSEEEVQEQLDFVLEYLGGDVEERTLPVIPYVMSDTKDNGKEFRGFGLFKFITRAMKMGRVMKKRDRSKKY